MIFFKKKKSEEAPKAAPPAPKKKAPPHVERVLTAEGWRRRKLKASKAAR